MSPPAGRPGRVCVRSRSTRKTRQRVNRRLSLHQSGPGGLHRRGHPYRWSPTFWAPWTRAYIGEGVYISGLQGAPGASIVEDSFSTDGDRMVLPSAGFTLLCTLVPNRPWWVPVCGPETGIPGLYRVEVGKRDTWRQLPLLPSLISRALRLKLTHGAPVRAP